MPRRRPNTQMFALPAPPAARIELNGTAYRLVRVFKHDFFAATCLYEAQSPARMPRVVVKYARTQPFCGLPMAWCGRLMRRHEQHIYEALSGLAGVPAWAGCLDDASYAVQYVDAKPLDHFHSPPPGVFDRLAEVLRAVHQRGVAYGDANKRSNILVGPGGQVFLVDYQISLHLRDDLPWPMRALVAAAVRYVQRADIYHLYKHKRRLAPAELTAEEAALSRRRGWLHSLHRVVTTPWRRLRRRVLRSAHSAGRLASPTADLEDHHQPEKATWRGE